MDAAAGIDRAPFERFLIHEAGQQATAPSGALSL